RQFLNSFGGHAHAAGLVINRGRINEFKQTINRLAHERLRLEDLLPRVDIDMELKLTDLTFETVSELECLEPYGAGNPEPLFYTKGLMLKGEPQVLGRDTLKFWVTDAEVTYPAIGFGIAELKDELLEAKNFDLVYTPVIDDWRDEMSVILEIEDIFFR
ncbi:MAG: hypothetical protein NC916_01860, partial [Candidatus Omnitrophica bacterium]|nr:hypothetical protein [Candidatus Omnitrophota bacterium]